MVLIAVEVKLNAADMSAIYREEVVAMVLSSA